MCVAGVSLVGSLLMLAGCGGSAPSSLTTPPAATVYVLTVNSTNPASGGALSASPVDTHGVTTGSTALTLSYNAGTVVTLTAPAVAGANTFGAWSGCASTSANACTITVNANAAVSVAYNSPVVYPLTVNSMNSSSGIVIAAAPADNGGLTSGTTSFSLSYAAGTVVKLTAPTLVKKNFGGLTSQLSIAHAPATAVSVKVFQYSNAQIDSIATGSSLTLPAPAAAGGSSSLTVTFPASSVTLLVVPKS